MATGRQAFEGKTQAGVIAAILEREPASVPRFSPARRRRWKADPHLPGEGPGDRRQTMHDLLLDLKWIAEGDPDRSPRRRVRAAPSRGSGRWVAAGIFLVAAVGLAGIHYRDAGREIRVVRASIPAPAKRSTSWSMSFRGRPPYLLMAAGWFSPPRSDPPGAALGSRSRHGAAYPLAGTDGAA